MEMRQKQLQTSLEQAHQEMFEYKSKQEDLTSARSSEIDILNQDLERANEVNRSTFFDLHRIRSTSFFSAHRMQNEKRINFVNKSNNYERQWFRCRQ